MGEEKHPGGAEQGEGSVNLESLLEQRDRVDLLIKQKYTRVITVMFTDLKGSTSITETHGDIVSRALIKHHNDIILPLIDSHRGVLVKTMGDGTLSYFENAADAVRAAMAVQVGIDGYNRGHAHGVRMLLRIGLNTGIGIVEKNDIFGDVVNVASRFESAAEPGEICMSESAWEALGEQRDEFCCRFLRTTALKEKRGVHKVFKVFWDPAEIERERAASPEDREPAERAEATPSPASTDTGDVAQGPEERSALNKARSLERAGELVELYILCEEHKGFAPLDEMHQALSSRLAGRSGVEVTFQGQAATWFGRGAASLGRVHDADVPVANKAMSRVCVTLGVREGQGFLEIASGGAPFKPVVIEKGNEKLPVRGEMEYPLGRGGRIVFSGCFPLEYRVHRDRFLVLKWLEPTDDLGSRFNLTLEEVWPDFARESARLIIIGIQ